MLHLVRLTENVGALDVINGCDEAASAPLAYPDCDPIMRAALADLVRLTRARWWREPHKTWSKRPPYCRPH